MFQHSFPSQCSCVVDSALGHDRCVLGLKEKSPASFACQHAPLCQVSCGLCVFLPIPFGHDLQCMLVQVSVG